MLKLVSTNTAKREFETTRDSLRSPGLSRNTSNDASATNRNRDSSHRNGRGKDRLSIQIIQQAMQEAKHNQRKAAENLGLTYHQFRGYLKKYDLVGTVSPEE